MLRTSPRIRVRVGYVHHATVGEMQVQHLAQQRLECGVGDSLHHPRLLQRGGEVLDRLQRRHERGPHPRRILHHLRVQLRVLDVGLIRRIVIPQRDG